MSETMSEQLIVPGGEYIFAPAVCAPCVPKNTKWIVVIVVLVLILALLLGIGVPAFLGLIVIPDTSYCPKADELENDEKFDINDPFKQSNVTQTVCEATNKDGKELTWRKWMKDCGKCCYNWDPEKKICYSWRKHCDAGVWEKGKNKCCHLGLYINDSNGKPLLDSDGARKCIHYGEFNFLEWEAQQ
jgi:hypothetical protein